MSITLHCIAKKHDGYWSARCLDFSLYAVGDSLEEAKAKLEIEIEDYLYEALEGDERENAAYLMLRKADFSEWALYHTLGFLARCKSLKKWIGESFNPPYNTDIFIIVTREQTPSTFDLRPGHGGAMPSWLCTAPTKKLIP